MQIQYSIPDTWILNHHTLDGYLFLRFLKIAVVTCLVGCVITMPVLFPINITGGGGQRQLDILTFANVQNNYFSQSPAVVGGVPSSRITG